MKIQILGTGCRKCNKLEQLAKEAVAELNCEVDVEKITDMNEIMKFDTLITPALAIDGDIKVAGKIPSKDQIKGWVNQN